MPYTTLSDETIEDKANTLKDKARQGNTIQLKARQLKLYLLQGTVHQATFLLPSNVSRSHSLSPLFGVLDASPV